MIEYIKEYGVTNSDYEYIVKNVPKNVLDTLILSEESVREVLSYYNSLGINETISKIIINRPDLIIVDRAYIEEVVEKIGKNIFYNVVKTSIEDLIVLGI